MKSLKTYSIPFTGIKLGKHQFEYAITDAFFEELAYSLVKKADLVCRIELEKQETMLVLDFNITGTIGLSCDKCLSQYPQQVDISEQQIAKFGDEEIDDDDEIITLKKNDFEINVAGLIYEYVTVSVPFFARCGNEGGTPYCDKEMLGRLNKLASGESETNKEQHDHGGMHSKNLNDHKIESYAKSKTEIFEIEKR